MSVSFEKKETNRGVLTFTISQEQIKPELDRVFNSVKKTINVPGFRKGHLPRPVFNQKSMSFQWKKVKIGLFLLKLLQNQK